jgi:hypothetical protein
MEIKTNKHGAHACSCCGFFTIKEIAETCPICFWEENFFQEENIEDDAGPNNVSLSVARENYKLIGAVASEFKHLVRKPKQEEIE